MNYYYKRFNKGNYLTYTEPNIFADSVDTASYLGNKKYRLRVKGNPYNLDTDILEKHGKRILKNVPRTFESLKEYLENHYIEGIVFYRETGEMCKIKRTDFGFEWK